MPALRPLLLILTALLFAFGGLARASEPATAEPPCHEAPAGHSGKAMLAMSCCIGCMPAPQALPAPLAQSRALSARTYPAITARLASRALAPETPPPRA